MTDEYLEAESLARQRLESIGNVSWATPNDRQIFEAYKKLVEAFKGFGEPDGVLEAMIRNSGFSDSTFILPGTKRKYRPPFTNCSFPEKDGVCFPVAACIYPASARTNPIQRQCPIYSQHLFFHEGVHFLANYGPKNSRLVPVTKIDEWLLADAIGGFFAKIEDYKQAKEIAGRAGLHLRKPGEPKNLLGAKNPFKLKFGRHCPEERQTAFTVSYNAFLEAEKKGEPEGLKFIYDLVCDCS